MIVNSFRNHAPCALALGIVLALVGCAGPPPRSAEHPLLTQASDAVVQCGKGARIRLVWSPYCTTCKPWLAEVDRLWRQNGKEGDVLGVVCDGEEHEVRKVVEQYRISFRQVMKDAEQCRTDYGLDRVPLLLVHDGCERLRYVSPEHLRRSDLERVVAFYLR